MSPLIQQLASTGVVGLVAAIFLTLYVLERKAHQKTADDRLEDVERFNTVVMALQKDAILAVQALAKITAHLEKQDAQKELLARELALRAGDTGQFNVPPGLRPPRPRGRGVDEDE